MVRIPTIMSNFAGSGHCRRPKQAAALGRRGGAQPGVDGICRAGAQKISAAEDFLGDGEQSAGAAMPFGEARQAEAGIRKG